MADQIPTTQTYAALLASIKERIKTAQVRAALAVNRELVLLYWGIGKEILSRQEQEGWGTKVIERLAKDLRSEFPEMKGFSRTNLLYMRAFSEAWPDETIVQQLVGQIPWGHNLRLIDLVKDPAERLWYVQAAIEYGWSRNILAMQIESDLYRRQGKAITNFQATLPSISGPSSLCVVTRRELGRLAGRSSSLEVSRQAAGTIRPTWSVGAARTSKDRASRAPFLNGSCPIHNSCGLKAFQALPAP
jgi:predicted nuclease of restriction endonuclease-like (RecB) superfamily